MLNNYSIYVLLITFIVHRDDLASTQECSELNFGAVWLASTEPNVYVGQIKVCNGSQWGAICIDGWDHFDAAVVCRELGYTADGKLLYYNTSIHLQDNLIHTMHCSCSTTVLLR
jgi:hypothetical protein